MTSRYLDLVFSDAVKAAQQKNGSRTAYARHDGATVGPDALPDALGEAEIRFLAARDSFYMASTGSGGWPYVQHRGGPSGFVKVLDERRFSFADFRGNRQYLSVGNLSGDDRAAFFFMDYPHRARLKLIGHVRAVTLEDEPDLAATLADGVGGAKIERAFIVDVEAYDWNCPQHITPRFTMEEMTPLLDTLKAKIAVLEAELAGQNATLPG